MYRILLSDDNLSLHQPLTEIAALNDVELTCFTNWERCQTELEDNPDLFHGLILDGKGKLEDSSKEADAKHVLKASKWLAAQQAKGRLIPAVVFTGFYAEISSFQGRDSEILEVFQKGDDTNSAFTKVLSFLKEAIEKSPEAKLRIAFPSAYSFSRKYFSNDNQELLVALFSVLDEPKHTFVWKKTMLDYLRRLNESLVDTILKHYYQPEFRIDDYIEKIKRDSSNKKANKGNRVVAIMDFFHDNEVRVPDPIYYAVRSVYHTASTYAVHNDEGETDFYPSIEMVKGLAYSHLGCYHWFDQIIKE